MVRVTASGYADPGDAPAGVTRRPRRAPRHPRAERDARGRRGHRPRPLPFKKADSFILIAEDDTLTVAQLGDDALLGATSAPGETISTTLAFSVGAAARVRFLCTPVEGSRPRSATWELSK